MISALVRVLGGARIAPPAPLPDDVAVVRGRWIPALSGRLAGMGRAAAAVTIGRTIVVHADVPLTPRLLRHELEHVRQWQARPLAFPLLYLWQHLRHGYSANRFEVAARAAESGTHAEHGATSPRAESAGREGDGA